MKKIYSFSLICFGLFLLNSLLLKLFRMPAFFSSYVNDLLCMPVVLGVCLFLIRKFSKNKQLKISLFSVLSLAALYSVYSEYYLPKVTERYTADVVDVLFYFTGAIIFWVAQKVFYQKSLYIP